MRDTKPVPKYQLVFEKLQADIMSGKYRPGQKLPSEAVLVRLFKTSRITVGRAIRELVHSSLVERQAGSGTYVRADRSVGLLFGLLIVDPGESEIFDPISHGIATALQARQHALVWGHTGLGHGSKTQKTLELCDQYIARKVSGVFFVPLKSAPGSDEANALVNTRLHRAGIPVVLLDRSPTSFPKGSDHDLISINNHRAGYVITEHLLNLGRSRIAFVVYPNWARSIERRVAGYREALWKFGKKGESRLIRLLDDPSNPREVEKLIVGTRADAVVCNSDRTAGLLMHSLIELGYRIPDDVAIVGFDDVQYARFLPVPLTTIHQPCWEIGEAAVAAMLERVANRDMPARDILLDTKLVVRQSCGASPKRTTRRRAAEQVQVERNTRPRR